MKSVVIYSSKRGTTLKYALWLADEIGADIAPLESCTHLDIYSYDKIIFGGWLRGSGIVGFNEFLDRLPKELRDRVIVFATGFSKPTPANLAQIAEINFEKGSLAMPFFLLPGAYYPDKVKGLDKFMLKLSKRVLLSGKVKGEEDDAYEVGNIIDNGIDMTDKSALEPVIKAVYR